MDKFASQAKLFKVLMHPVRLAILDILREDEECVCHMEATLGYRQAYISQHLMLLRDAGLVTDRRDGWNIFYRVSKPEIYAVIDAMNALSNPPGDAKTSPAAPVKKRPTCPCPKCSPGSNAIRHEPSVLALERVDTTV